MGWLLTGGNKQEGRPEERQEGKEKGSQEDREEVEQEGRKTGRQEDGKAGRWAVESVGKDRQAVVGPPSVHFKRVLVLKLFFSAIQALNCWKAPPLPVFATTNSSAPNNAIKIPGVFMLEEWLTTSTASPRVQRTQRGASSSNR